MTRSLILIHLLLALLVVVCLGTLSRLLIHLWPLWPFWARLLITGSLTVTLGWTLGLILWAVFHKNDPV